MPTKTGNFLEALKHKGRVRVAPGQLATSTAAWYRSVEEGYACGSDPRRTYHQDYITALYELEPVSLPAPEYPYVIIDERGERVNAYMNFAHARTDGRRIFQLVEVK